MNWLTMLFIVLFLASIYQGWRRRFASEAGFLASQITHIAAAVASVASAWFLSARLAKAIPSIHVPGLTTWTTQFQELWHQNPQVSHIVLVLVCYLVISNIFHAIVRPIPYLVVRRIPTSVAQSKGGGAILGALVGGARAVFIGAIVFVLLQLFSIPALQVQAAASAPYQTLDQGVFQPWLKPFVTRELPVLTENAIGPISENISLFALPTGQQGMESGMLVVPKEISELAASITKGKSTTRDKAYALYEWEIHHIKYDWNKYNDYVYRQHWDQQSPLDTLHTGKGVCADYALLYAEMAHSVGISVEIVEGIGGTSAEYGPHAWNRYLDDKQGSWVNVDTTWGAEQDIWFDAPNFGATHRTQQTIRINGGTH